MRLVIRRGLIAVMMVVVGAGVVGTTARVVLRRGAPAPGVLIDMGGYQMHLHCTGTGEPTVILEAGLLDFSLLWSRVQPASSTVARTCSYDRAGSGWSEPSPRARTSEGMVDELRELMSRAEIAPPFVLVGHSFGGMNVRLYARRFPGEVAGLVIVDGAHEEQWARLPELNEAGSAVRRQFRSLAWMQRTGLLALARSGIPDRGLPTEAARQYRTLLATSPYFANVVHEVEALGESVAQLRATGALRSPDLPVVVISRGLPAPVPGLAAEAQARVESVWRELQAALAAEAPGATHLIAVASSHDIHLQQPMLVVHAIDEVIRGTRVHPTQVERVTRQARRRRASVGSNDS